MTQQIYDHLKEINSNDNSSRRILNAAIYLFAKNNYKSTSTKELANYAGVSEALVYKLYKSKHNLLVAVINEIVSHRLPNLLNLFIDDSSYNKIKISSMENVKKILFHKANTVNQNWSYIKILVFELNELDETSYNNIKELANSVIKKACHVIDLLKEAGFIKKELSSRLLFRSFIGMVNFAIIDINFLDKSRNFKDEFEQIFDLFLKGASNE